jgi:hypothetical protein
MTIKHIVDEWLNDYKKPSMFIFTGSCSGKCCTELELPAEVCQNHAWALKESHWIPDEYIYKRYISNKITKAIVFGGLEPFEQFGELIALIRFLRLNARCFDDIVIYTGYYPYEIESELEQLRRYGNIIVKFGRYIPDKPSRYDEVLGVELCSDNQYAEKLW